MPDEVTHPTAPSEKPLTKKDIERDMNSFIKDTAGYQNNRNVQPFNNADGGVSVRETKVPVALPLPSKGRGAGSSSGAPLLCYVVVEGELQEVNFLTT